MSDKDPKKKSRITPGFMKAAAVSAALFTIFAMSNGDNNDPQGPLGGTDVTYEDDRGQEKYRGENEGATDQRQRPQQAALQEIPYSDFIKNVKEKEVERVVIQQKGYNILVGGKLQNGNEFVTAVPATGHDRLVELLEENEVKFAAKPMEQPSQLVSILPQLLFPLLLIGLIVWKKKNMAKNGGPGGMSSFGKSKAQLLTEQQTATFDDVAGIDSAKAELQQIVDFLRRPEEYSRMGARIPTGALLVGPPGTGKTLTARAIAGEAKVPFFKISGSDFVEMFVGVGASRVRDMFAEAKKNAPCIIFIDEIDAVGRKRGVGMSNDEREQTLNQLLVEMDGFDKDTGIIVVAATNRPDVLDPALLRPGRFDRQVVVPAPGLQGREEILKVHMRNVPLADDVNPLVIARGTPGFSGADLANLVNEAALTAVARKKDVVDKDDFEEARDKVLMGLENKQMAVDEKERERTAYHEAGHAIVGLFTDPQCDPLHKVTITPRGQALGVTMNLPEKDQVSVDESQLKAKLAMMFGGREAERKIYGEDKITTGASNDIQQATGIARRMVTEWGMSEKLGRVRYIGEDSGSYLGNSGRPQGISESTAKLIDDEIKRLTGEAEEKARELLEKHADKFEALTKALLEYETVSGAEVKELFETGKISRPLPVAESKEQDKKAAEPEKDTAETDKAKPNPPTPPNNGPEPSM